MRILMPSFLAGFLAIATLTGLPMFFDKKGDSHIGVWIYILEFVALLASHVLGTVAMFSAWRWQKAEPLRGLKLPVVLVFTLGSYAAAYLLIVRLAFGFWVWKMDIALLLRCLIIGVISAGVFAFSTRIRPV